MSSYHPPAGHSPESPANGDTHAHEHEHGHGHGHEHLHGHGHAHGHGHHHHAPPTQVSRAFVIGIVLNALFVAAEFGFGLLADSLALVADAGHNLSDVLSLVLAWGAIQLAQRHPTPRHTYGLRRGTIVSSLLSSLLLLVVMAIIAWEALQRLRTPEPVDSNVMIVVAAVGVLINGITAWLLAADRHHDINVRAAFLHMAGDAGVSAGVVLGGIGIALAGWAWLDPLISLVIAAIIVWSTWEVLREALEMSFDAVPRGIDIEAVHRYLATLPGVSSVHDLHIWAMSTTETALTAHLVMPSGHGDDRFLRDTGRHLAERFRIAHTTLQVEHDDPPGCGQSCVPLVRPPAAG